MGKVYFDPPKLNIDEIVETEAFCYASDCTSCFGKRVAEILLFLITSGEFFSVAVHAGQIKVVYKVVFIYYDTPDK